MAVCGAPAGASASHASECSALMDKHSTDLRRMPPSPALQQIIDSKMIRQLARRMMLSASKC